MPVLIKHFRDIPAYQGEHAIPGIRFRAARQAMDIQSWGMNILELDPNCEGYPEHDHNHAQQEELYLVLEGSLVLRAEGKEHTLQRGDLVRVPADVTRKFVTREHAAILLALGGTRGKAYTPDPRMPSE